MASREMIREMLVFLASTYGRTLNEPLIDGFYEVFKKVSESGLARAAYAYCDEGKKMPTPADIKERLPSTEHHEQLPYRIDKAHCAECGKETLCIREAPYSETWRCRECYSGLSAEKYQAKMWEIIEAMNHKRTVEKYG